MRSPFPGRKLLRGPGDGIMWRSGGRRSRQSVVGFGHGDVDADGEDVSFAVGSVAVIEAYGAVGAKVVGIAGFGGVKTLDAVCAAPRGHLALAIEDEINFFCDFVMVREVGAGRSKIHQEEIHDVV